MTLDRKTLLVQYAYCTMAALGYALGMNLFVFPHNLYAGGLFGITQLLFYGIRTSTGLNLSQQYVSILYFAFNIPLFYLLYKTMRKSFFFKTIYSVLLQSLFMMLIPIPTQAIVNDRLTAVIAGAIVTGISLGWVLKSASSSGGVDIIGLYLSRKYKGFSLGRISVAVNLCIYAISGILFGIETMVYSMIYTIITSFIIDRFHYQNISITSLVITREVGMYQHIMKELDRGSTIIKGEGAYTHEESLVLLTVISKYEKRLLTRIVQSYDPKAFIIFINSTDVRGNFIKRFDN